MRRREWIFIALLLSAVIGFGANIKPVTVLGDSMEPTLRAGQSVWVWRLAYLLNDYRPGDIIVFKADDGEELIKRIAFVQDPLGTRKMPNRIWTPAGSYSVPQLMIGTGRLEFPGYREGILEARAGAPLRRRIFVLGDNIWQADDSRRFGPIDPASILGKVVRIAPLPRGG